MVPRIAQFKSADELRRRLDALGLNLPLDSEVLTAEHGSPLAQPLPWGERRLGNRWCIHPMEGWDGLPDGNPSELTLRRWRNFGRSGAKLIWGGEAAAVREDGRDNPGQLLATPRRHAGLAALLAAVRDAHAAECGSSDDLAVGLQLIHSGRFAQPTGGRSIPRLAFHHPLLDAKFGVPADDTTCLWSDDELDDLGDAFVTAARVAQEVGYDFVDIKACHGYLLHELLGARRRPGRYGGDLAGRSRLLTTIVRRIHAEVPGLAIGVRLSAFDTVPYVTSTDVGRPYPFDKLLPYDCGFGVNAMNPLEIDLTEPLELLRELARLGVISVNVSAGSPYYCPHIQRPAFFPPSDGYQPPEDPLIGVWRQIDVTRQCKQAVPQLIIVGTGYSYLQDYLPHVAQAVVRAGWADAVGLGRMVLAYPTLPADALRLGRLERKKVCRTFSDCTTAPRNGLPSGCYPLDPYYKSLPEGTALRRLKAER